MSDPTADTQEIFRRPVSLTWDEVSWGCLSRGPERVPVGWLGIVYDNGEKWETVTLTSELGAEVLAFALGVKFRNSTGGTT